VIQRALDAGCTPILVHEQADAYIRFRQLMEITPAVLKAAPYRLYDTPATPLYPTPEHRKACMLGVLKEMRAVARHAQGGSSRFNLTRLTSSWSSSRPGVRQISRGMSTHDGQEV
jgi:hypothetical protein